MDWLEKLGRINLSKTSVPHGGVRSTLIEFVDPYLYAGSGSSVSAINLRNVKSTHTVDSTSTELDTVSDRQLKASTSSSIYSAFYNDSDIFVFKGGALAQKYSTPQQLICARFHPLDKCSIVYLTVDGMIAIIHVPTNHRYTLDFTEHFRRGIGVKDTLKSFHFCSNKKSIWSSFTLYIVTSSFDMYSLCPVVPVQFELSRSHLEKMYSSYPMSTEQLMKKPHMYWSKKLIEYWRTTSDFSSESHTPGESRLHEDILRLEYPSKTALATLKPVLQGPYLLKPDPSIGLVHDIFACGEDSAFDMIVVAHGGGVSVGLAESPRPFWELGNLKGKVPFPSLYTLESITLPNEHKNTTQSIRLLKDPLDRNKLHVISASGVLSLAFPVLDSPLLETLQSGHRTTVTWLATCSTSRICDACVVTDVYLGYSLLVSTLDKLSGLELKISPAQIRGGKKTTLEQMKKQVKSKQRESRDKETAVFELKLETKNVSLPLSSRQRYPEFVSEKSLRPFGVTVIEFRNNLVSLMNGKEYFGKYLVSQRKVLEKLTVNQRESVHKARYLQEVRVIIAKKLEVLLNRHKNNVKRADVALSILYELAAGASNEDEVAWNQELVDFKITVDAFRKEIDQLLSTPGLETYKLTNLPKRRMGKINGIDGVYKALVEERELILKAFKEFQILEDRISSIFLKNFL